MRQFFILFTIVILISPALAAFDGERTGIVVGGGIGGTLAATWSNAEQDIDESDDGLAWHGMGGLAIDSANMFVIEYNAARHSPEDWVARSDYVDVTQRFLGAVWYHYFGPTGNSLFACAGMGNYQFSIEVDGNTDSDNGFGYLVGGGWEFTRSAQIALYMSGTRYGADVGTNGHFHINFLVSVITY